MNVFLPIVALICALVLWLILRPLLAGAPLVGAPIAELNLAVLRDQLRELDIDLAQGSIDAAAYAAARGELEQRVAEDVRPAVPETLQNALPRWQAAALGLAVLAGAAVLYAALGTPQAMGTKVSATASAPHGVAAGADAGAGEAEVMVVKLAERLARTPQDPDGWMLLARSYSAMGRFVAASDAYAHLVSQIPDDAQILADYADVVAMSQQQRLRGEPERLLVRALAADPHNVKALILMGDADFERADLVSAGANWQAALVAAPAGSEFARMAGENLAHLASLAADGVNGKAVNGGGAAMTAAAPALASGATTISGVAELDPSLRGQVSDSDTVFIVAKAVDGPRFPLAVLRRQVKDLPLRFVLDDSMGMMPDVKLSQFARVTVSARISKSGNAQAASGDLESVLEPVVNGAGGVSLRIVMRRP